MTLEKVIYCVNPRYKYLKTYTYLFFEQVI